MPSGLFLRAEEGPWSFGPLKGYSGDHLDLFVRYLRSFTEKESRALER
jgi:hypothetical protein